MKMSASFNFNSPDSGSSQKDFNAFQRRKIGSIRDNSKLSKILQQFENGGCNSAPCSISKRSNFSQVFALATTALKENPVLKEIETSNNFLRRHSEGEVVESRTKRRLLLDTFEKQPTSKNSSSNVKLEYQRCKPNKVTNGIASNNSFLKNSNLRESHTKSRFVPTATSSTHGQSKDKQAESSPPSNNNKSAKDLNILSNETPPPIPRRGLSLPVTSIMQDQSVNSSKKTSPVSSSPRLPTSSNNVIKQDSVKNAIQMYEGLSTKSLKFLRTGKRDSLNDYKKVGLTRKSSKRNSFKSPKPGTEAKRHNISSLNPDSKLVMFRYSKEDSGIGFSDPEDLKSPQGIYQSLCSVTPTGDQCDTYDRLNRVHDMMNRIHDGQSSNCAACKAIPIESMQLSRAMGASVLQVKCNVLSPHHHPPCICFSCQHSVFSCVQGVPSPSHDSSLESLSFLDQEESLYYNVCCLNKPNCEGWRRSRRRPVCEQNGRVCMVNCDMNQNPGANDFYEKIFEWNTKKPDQCDVRKSPKQPSGDSCDSDEGWVDITDSEDERLSMPVCPEQALGNNQCSNTAFPQGGHPPILTQEMRLNIDKLETMYSKMGIENMSRAESSEHLYETIGDIEVQRGSIEPEVQSKSVDNEPDSGEWSTESSSSPTPTEQTTVHAKVENKPSATSASSRFSIASDCENYNSKKMFMKNVLGKKSAVPKKRRMSHFFVPWLANHEYGSRSPKTVHKKQNTRKVDRTFSKTQRSQSIPLCAKGAALSVAKIFSSTEILDRCQSDSKELEQIPSTHSDSSFGLSAESIDLLSQRGSLASSTYINTDQLRAVPVRQRSSVPDDSAITDVAVDKIFHRSASRDSVHSYFVFRPIKEEEVPLYQFYERNIKERVALCRSPDCLSPVMWSTSLDSGCASHECQKSSLVKPQLSVVEQLSPDAKDIKMLWCELPEVKESGILVKISAQELKLQEATFEFIQSQASYIRSLKVLYEHFIKIPEFSDPQSSFCVLSKHEHDVLFSDIILVKEVSERLMADLTTRWSDDILIPDICDIIYRHTVMPSFSVYVKYCSNRIYQERTLKELKETRLCFLEVLRKLESNPTCQGLSLESFLFLPMQHITRLPLLLDNIFRWLNADSPSFNTCKMALEAVHKVFMECNDSARKMERLEEMFILNKQLEFKECKVIPLISASRWLLKKGELVKLEFDKKTFGRSSRCSKVPMYLFLFNDLLIVTKRKNEDSYSVLDYCLRDKVQAMAVDAKDLQQPDLVPSSCHYLIYLTLFSNHQNSSVDIILNCTLQSERTRWIEAIHPLPKESNTEVWEHDSPQVQSVRSYVAQQPDELSLQESDIVTIHRKMNDGWYEGRRLRDGLQGWFPASYTMDIPCSRARASNLRQCYRLLMLSQNHESKKRT